MEIFKLIGRILVDSDEADKSISKTEKKAGGLAKGFKKVAKGAAVVGTGVVAAGTAIFGMATKTAAGTDRIDKLSQRLGISRKGFQEWDYVLSQAGVSIDSMQNGMKTMAQRMSDAAEGTGPGVEVFDKLKVSVTDASGAMRSQEEIFNESIKALQGMEDGVKKADLAQKLFGRNGQELLPLLNGTAGSVDELKAKANELGLVMGDDVIDAGVNFTDTMDTLKKTASAGLIPVISGIMPVVQKLADMFIQYIPQIMSTLAPLFDTLMPVFSDLVIGLMPMLIDLITMFTEEILPPLLPIITDLIMTALPIIVDLITMIVKDILPALMPLITIIVTELLPPIMTMIGSLGKTLFPILANVLVVLAEAITPIIQLFSEILAFILPPLTKVIGFLAELIAGALTSAFAAIQPVIDNAIGFFKNLIGFIKNVFAGDWSAAWENVVGMFKNIFEGIINYVKYPINAVIGLINKLFERVGTINLPEWLGGKIALPQIPLLAEGGTAIDGGLSIVGERGPELINMPKGAKVIPLNDNDKAVGNTTNNFYINGDTSPYGIIRAAKKKAQILAV